MQRIFFSFLSVLVLILLCAGAAMAENEAGAALPDKPASVPDRNVPVSVLHTGEDSIGAKDVRAANLYHAALDKQGTAAWVITWPVKFTHPRVR